MRSRWIPILRLWHGRERSSRFFGCGRRQLRDAHGLAFDGYGDPGDGRTYLADGGHGNTGIAHKAMLTAGKVLALAAVRFYEEPELAEAAKKELAEETGGVYECPIPKEIGPRLRTRDEFH